MSEPYGRKRRKTDDPDNPTWTAEDFARARPGAEVLPPDVVAAFGKPRGRPKAVAPKVAVKLRLDPDVVAAFKATGAGWQTRINTSLREAAAHLSGDKPSRKGRAG
jgi:uncharacterized protein (DUF4415 family)